MGLDWCYLCLPVPPGLVETAVSGAAAMGAVGLSVTTPHKEAAARACQLHDELVTRLGAANTVTFLEPSSLEPSCLEPGSESSNSSDGERGVTRPARASSTDGIGLVRYLREELEVELTGSVVAVLGAGGAGRSIIAALATKGLARLMVVNRTRHRAEASLTLGSVVEVAEPQEVAEADIVINSTSVGFGRTGNGLPLDIDAHCLRPGQTVIDTIYEPECTPLLAAATVRGARTANGLGMLVYQAAAQIELWSGQAAPIAEMWEAARAARNSPS
jgi:shikimate dehydrogenase